MNNSGIQQKLDMNRLRKRALVVAALGLIAIAIAAIFVTHAISRHYFGINGTRLLAIVVDLSKKIDGDDHAKLRRPSDRKSEAYEKITQLLEGCQRDNPIIFSAYTMRVMGDNAWLIVSPPVAEGHGTGIEEDLLLRDAIGIPYMSSPDLAMRNASSGIAMADREFTHDHWGDWLTACAPLKTMIGQVDGIVCVDEEKKALSRSILKKSLSRVGFCSRARDSLLRIPCRICSEESETGRSPATGVSCTQFILDKPQR